MKFLNVNNPPDELKDQLDMTLQFGEPFRMLIGDQLACFERSQIREVVTIGPEGDLIDLTNRYLGGTAVRFARDNTFFIEALEIPAADGVPARVILFSQRPQATSNN